jgi:hypothetical protein
MVALILLGCVEEGETTNQTHDTPDGHAPGVIVGAPPDGSDTAAEEELTLTGVSPTVIDPDGGSHVTISGAGFTGVTGVAIGGAAATQVTLVSDTELAVTTGAVPAADGLDVVVTRDELSATLEGAVDAWSPAEIPDARVFDAATGVTATEKGFTYEWQRLTDDIGDDWIVRDGNTLSWLPSTNKFWMVAGWNGYLYPDGFDTDGDESNWPLLNTTTEVWSSPDGADWTLELPATNTQFERRHAHNTVLWNDRLWMVGGDAHQGYYNHDVVSSADGVRWTVELGEYAGKPAPPWSERALQMAGVYDGKLWMAGGQDLMGDPYNPAVHNDVWVTENGVDWTEVAPDAEPSATRWRPCGVMTQLVEFQGEMWLVGCALYDETNGFEYYNEVWSTTNGARWEPHTTPPWDGKMWHNVLVWDEKIWVISGSTATNPNNSETWYSEDGETWVELATDRCQQPGSHGQGVTSRDDGIYYAGGNYSFGGAFSYDVDKSAWRLVKFNGLAVDSWTDRGDDALVVEAPSIDARPVRVEDAFGEDMPGLQFDGSASSLDLSTPDVQSEGRSVFWVARAPFLRTPATWDDSYNPVATVVGGEVGVFPGSSAGLTGGQVVYSNQARDLDANGSPMWEVTRAGTDLQHMAGEVRFAGVTHATDGTVQIWVDGAAEGAPGTGYYGTGYYGTERGWSRIGGGIIPWVDSYFAGTLGAVVIVPATVDAATIERIHQWSIGRFGAR